MAVTQIGAFSLYLILNIELSLFLAALKEV
jgi:hypothetical protein